MADQAVLSVQLYSLRSLGDLDRALDAVAAAGYGNVELVGSHLADARETQARLRAHGLAAPTSHVGLAALRERFEATVDACGAIGIGQLFMPAVPPEQRGMDAAGWSALGHELGPRGLVIVGISMDDTDVPVRAFVRREGVDYPVAVGDAALGERFGGILALPTKLVIDRDGRIADKRVGPVELGDLAATLRARLAE